MLFTNAYSSIWIFKVSLHVKPWLLLYYHPQMNFNGQCTICLDIIYIKMILKHPGTGTFLGMDSEHQYTILVESGSTIKSVCSCVCVFFWGGGGMCLAHQSNYSLKDQGLENYLTGTKGPVFKDLLWQLWSTKQSLLHVNIVLLSFLHRPIADS